MYEGGLVWPKCVALLVISIKRYDAVDILCTGCWGCERARASAGAAADEQWGASSRAGPAARPAPVAATAPRYTYLHFLR